MRVVAVASSVTPPPPTAAPVPRPNESAAATTRSSPPSRVFRAGPWLLLLLVLAIVSPTLLLELRRPQVTNLDEARAIATTMQTRDHFDTVSKKTGLYAVDPYVPYRNGIALEQSPPGTTWVQLGFDLALREADDSIDTRVWKIRLSAVAMALLLIAGVYWAGFSLGGMRVAALAALVCAANPWLVHHGRTASTPIYAVAWASLAVAAALWALRPLRPAPTVARQAIGWTLCGLASMMTALTVGPWGLAMACVTVLLFVVILPDRFGHLMGLIASVMVAVLGLIPWIVYTHESDAGAWGYMPTWAVQSRTELPGMGSLGGPWELVERVIVLLVTLVPWTFWLVGAVLQPFSTSSRGVRTRMFVGWAWFALAGAAAVLAPKDLLSAAVLAAAPACAVLIAQLFEQYANRADTGHYARLWRLLRWPHIAACLIISVVLALTLHNPRGFADTWLPTIGSPEQTSNYYAIGSAAVLLLALGLGAWYAIKQFPARSLTAWAIWGVLVIIVMIPPLSRGPSSETLLREEGARIASAAGKLPVLWFSPTGLTPDSEPDPRLSVYASRAMAPMPAAELSAAGAEPFILLAPKAMQPDNPRLIRMLELPQAGLTMWRMPEPRKGS